MTIGINKLHYNHQHLFNYADEYYFIDEVQLCQLVPGCAVCW